MSSRIEKRDIIAIILIPMQLLIGWIIALTPIK
jgi:hypothetical protein